MKEDELRQADESKARTWFESRLPQKGPMSLLPALRSLRNHSLSDLIAATRDLINSPELQDDRTAPGHFASLFEALVWRFEGLVRNGVFDEVLPRLSGLPILYSPLNGKGAREWKAAHDLFKAKAVASDTFSAHRGFEASLARRIDYGVVAGQTARLAWHSGLELEALMRLRENATAVWLQEIGRKRGTEPTRIKWYYCQEFLIRWPDWLDLCAGLPNRRDAAPERYRAAAAGILSEFIAQPNNKIAEEMAGVPAEDADYALALAEMKRRILDAVDRL